MRLLCIAYFTFISSYAIGQFNAVINAIELGDTIQIQFHSAGCFNSHSESINLHKTDSVFYLRFQEYEIAEYSENLRPILRPKGYARVLELESDQVMAINDFEKSLVQVRKDGGCTSSILIVVFIKGHKLVYRDNTCEWRGYSTFKRRLGLIDL